MEKVARNCADPAVLRFFEIVTGSFSGAFSHLCNAERKRCHPSLYH